MNDAIKQEIKQWAAGGAIFLLSCAICGFILGATAADHNDMQVMQAQASKSVAKQAMRNYGNIPLSLNENTTQEPANGISQ